MEAETKKERVKKRKKEKERTRKDQTHFSVMNVKSSRLGNLMNCRPGRGRERETFWDLRNKDKGKDIQLQRFLFSPNPLLVSLSPHLIFKACHLVPSCLSYFICKRCEWKWHLFPICITSRLICGPITNLKKQHLKLDQCAPCSLRFNRSVLAL